MFLGDHLNDRPEATVRRWRPLRDLALRTLRPAFVDLRALYPRDLSRRVLDGWYVRLVDIVDNSCDVYFTPQPCRGQLGVMFDCRKMELTDCG